MERTRKSSRAAGATGGLAGVVGFGTWLAQQKTHDAVGDLARDYAADRCRPRRATLEDVSKHLDQHHATCGAVEALRLAARRYKAYRRKLSY